jgi:hypothetical protein
MRNITIIFMLCIAYTSAFGQYKKASFFTKPGRFYEAGLSVLNFSNVVKPAAGILFNRYRRLGRMEFVFLPNGK